MRKKKNQENETNKSKSRIAVLILTILSLITSAVSIVDLYLLTTLESFQKYIYLAIIILIIIDLLLIIKTKKRWSKKTTKKLKNKGLIAFQVIYFIITAAFAGLVTYTYLFLGSFNKSYVTYSTSLVVMSDSKIDKVKDLKNYSIGILKDKTSPEGYIIPKEVIKENNLEDYNTLKKYNNYSSMIADLYAGDIDAIFISSNYVSMFNSVSTYETIEEDTKVILKKSKKMAKISTNKKEKVSSGKKITEPFTILLMGVDSTDEGLSKNTVANGDSLILITFNPKTLNATMLSIPRDSYVPIACWSNKAENKITHAAAYGTDCMMQTIENYFDINIDYYAKINFKGLVHLVDAIGGIDVEVPKDLCTDDSSRGKEVCIKAGQQHLDGEGALVLARNRKQLAAGDLDRGQNQQLVIQALLNKMKTIKNASQFLNILNTISNNLDTNFTTSQILSFYNIAEDIMNNNLAKNDANIVNITRLYLQGTGQMIYDENIRMVLWDYIPNKDSKKDVMNAMKTNLELLDHDTYKDFSFSINEEYEKEIIGYGPYKKNYTYDLVPNFRGLSKSAATSLASKYGINVSFSGTSGTVTSQSAPANKRVDKLNGAVTLTLSSSSTTEDKTTTTKKDNKETQQTEKVTYTINYHCGNDVKTTTATVASGTKLTLANISDVIMNGCTTTVESSNLPLIIAENNKTINIYYTEEKTENPDQEADGSTPSE